ncbi:unnamed protein product, partial [Heterotrigona itama]
MEIRPKIALAVQRRNSSSSNSSSNTNSDSTTNSSGGDSNVSSAASSNGGNRDEERNGNENENGNGSSASSSVTRSARSSEDDITLNEMMGKFDESYIYEKETDILSDSDPTDCEDYIESLSDLEGPRDVVGDENDPLDNDFDYIDNGSFLDLADNLDCSGRFANTGHCTYFAFAGELARRSSRLRETMSTKNGHTARKQMTRQRKQQADEKQSSEKRKKRSSQRRKSNFNKRDVNASLTG